MMENLRTKANSPLLKIILALIILSFVLGGVMMGASVATVQIMQLKLTGNQ